MPTRSNTALLAFALLAGGGLCRAASCAAPRSASTMSMRAPRRSPTRRSRTRARTCPARCSISITIATRRSASSPRPRAGAQAKLPFELELVPRRLAVRPAGQAQRDRQRQGVSEIAVRHRSSSTTRRAASIPLRSKALGYAGFSAHYALNLPVYKDDVLAFLGASYFRALGKGQMYGLSARGLAIDTAVASGEEFPRFVEFWFEKPDAHADALVFYALLDSPRATGAYRFAFTPGVDSIVEVTARDLSARQGRQARHRAADEHVLPRREPARGRRRLPARSARFGRAFDPVEAPANGSGVRWSIRSASSSPRSRSDSPRGFGLMQRAALVRRLPGSFDALRSASERVDRADRRMGQRAASSSCRFRRPTRPTTTSSRTGFPTARRRRSSRSTCTTASTGRRMTRRVRRPRGSPRRGAARATCPKPDDSLGFVIDFAGPMLTQAARRTRRSAPTSRPTRTARSSTSRVRRNPETGGARLELHLRRVDDDRSRSSCAPRSATATTVSETWSYALPPG